MTPEDEARLADYDALHREMFPDMPNATHEQRLEAIRALARAFNLQRATLAAIHTLLRGAP